MTDMAAVIARLRKLPDSPMRRSIEEVLSFTRGDAAIRKDVDIDALADDKAATSPASIFNDTEGRN